MLTEWEQGFRLGEVEVNPAECVIVTAGQARKVEPKVMDVLVALANAGGKIIGREQLTAAVWPRGFVTDDALNRCISSLRSALGETPKDPRHIVTVPRKGYRLAVSPEPMEQASPRRGMLVLPFQDLSEGAESCVADGLTELLIARLAVALIQPVISRTTAMTFKGSQRDLASIGVQLGVRWVVEGSVLQMGGQVQIVVQLIDALDDAHVWSETWTRPAGDMLTVLNEISRLVTVRVRSELQGQEATATREQALPTDVLRHYLHGIALNSKRAHGALHSAAARFRQVLDVAPDYVPALSGLAQTYVLLAHYGAIPAAEGFGQAREYAEAALALAPESDVALAQLAAVEFFFDWDFRRAAERIDRALRINPANDFGRLMAANIDAVNGRGERALSHLDRALEVDPLNVGLLMNSGDHLILQRRFTEAARPLADALDIEPGFRPARLRLALAQALGGRREDALSQLEAARATDGEDAAYLEFLAIVQGALGHAGAAAEAAARLDKLAEDAGPVAPWARARAWAAAGNYPRSLGHLQAAFEARSSSIPFLGISPVLDRVRALPEVQVLMARIGLP